MLKLYTKLIAVVILKIGGKSTFKWFNTYDSPQLVYIMKLFTIILHRGGKLANIFCFVISHSCQHPGTIKLIQLIPISMKL